MLAVLGPADVTDVRVFVVEVEVDLVVLLESGVDAAPVEVVEEAEASQEATVGTWTPAVPHRFTAKSIVAVRPISSSSDVN